MRNDEIDKFFEELFDHAMGFVGLTLLILASPINVFVALIRGIDSHSYHHGDNVTTRINDVPWPACWEIEKWILALTLGPIIVNYLIVKARDSFGKSNDGLTRRDRKALRAAESKAALAERITVLERDALR